VALLKAPTKQKTATLQVRLEEEVRITLNRYAQFIDANPSYVVSEALKLLFKRDQEFKRWLGQHMKTGGQDQQEGAVLAKAASQT
jgi:predicted transcriptional regulator